MPYSKIIEGANVNPYQEYINQLTEETRYLRQEMALEKPGSRIWTANRNEIKANTTEIEIMKQLMKSDLTLMEKTQ